MQRVISTLQGVSVEVDGYQRKRDFLYENLTGMGYKVNKPKGAFYMFPESPIKDDVAFIKELTEHKVLTVPGAGFGCPGYFRISYCVNNSVIEGSLDGFRKVAQKYKLS